VVEATCTNQDHPSTVQESSCTLENIRNVACQQKFLQAKLIFVNFTKNWTLCRCLKVPKWSDALYLVILYIDEISACKI